MRNIHRLFAFIGLLAIVIVITDPQARPDGRGILIGLLVCVGVGLVGGLITRYSVSLESRLRILQMLSPVASRRIRRSGRPRSSSKSDRSDIL
jgi:hypothetical protein